MTIREDRSLKSPLPHIRDQGMRPTCLAFAVSDAHAYVASTRSELSVEWIHYHSAMRTQHRDVHRGCTIPSIVEALHVDGQPHENVWPYINIPRSNLSAAKPQVTTADVFKRKSEAKKLQFDEVADSIAQNKPMIVILRISDSFMRPDAYGIIDSANEGSEAGIHAVIAIASGIHPVLGRMLRIRNSWGGKWGQAGHGWIDDRYYSRRIVNALNLLESP